MSPSTHPVVEKLLPEGSWAREQFMGSVTPQALVDPATNRFIAANPAYEKLTGYPRAALYKLTWMDITVAGDVGNDAACVAEVLSGERDEYTMPKRYNVLPHGTRPVMLTVRRWPRDGTILCLWAQAPQMEPLKIDDKGRVSAKINWPEFLRENPKLATTVAGAIVAIATALITALGGGGGAPVDKPKTPTEIERRVDKIEDAIDAMASAVHNNSALLENLARELGVAESNPWGAALPE